MSRQSLRSDLSLTINPTLTWNTFLGGNGGQVGTAIAVDGSGNVYVAGGSATTWVSPVRAYPPRVARPVAR